MGTRNLTIVYVDGEYKVAQYCQWDGYPEGQGAKCLDFLRNKMNEEKFRKELHEVVFAKENLYMKIFKMFGGDEEGFISCSDHDRLKAVFPELHRDTGAKILEMIQNGEVQILQNAIDFAADGVSCEYAWVIDLDKRTFEAYQGFSHEPTKETDRFYFLREFEDTKDYGDGMYTCVKKTAEWSIDNLPTKEEFLKAFEQDGEQE